MNVKKFVAANSREAYRLVREALGADAVILSNRSVGNGVEILALANEDMSSLVEPKSEARPQPAARRENFRDDQAESWQMPQRKGLGASEPLPKMSQSAPFISRRTSDDDQAANLAGVLANAHGE